jgi:cullin-associated NEDD8-dissociated protein 1
MCCVCSLHQSLAPHVVDRDLFLSQHVLALVAALLPTHPAACAAAKDSVLPRVLVLLRSPLVQGATQDSAVRFFERLCECDVSLDVGALLNALWAAVAVDAKAGGTTPHQMPSLVPTPTLNVNLPAALSVARCMAAVATSPCVSHRVRVDCIQRYRTFAASAGPSPAPANGGGSEAVAALYFLGAVGQRSAGALDAAAVNTVFGALDTCEDGVRQAAAFALGQVAAGDAALYVPQLMTRLLRAPADTQLPYLLLIALAELFAFAPALPALGSVLAPLPAQLTAFADAAREDVRAMTGRCLGALVGVAGAAGNNALQTLSALLAHTEPRPREVTST